MRHNGGTQCSVDSNNFLNLAVFRHEAVAQLGPHSAPTSVEDHGREGIEMNYNIVLLFVRTGAMLRTWSTCSHCRLSESPAILVCRSRCQQPDSPRQYTALHSDSVNCNSPIKWPVIAARTKLSNVDKHNFNVELSRFSVYFIFYLNSKT